MTESYLQIAANNEELARDIVERASARGVTVSTAESLTAGMIASTIADIPGASAVLRGGAVTYCDEIKHRVLGVEQETLDRFSAVSHQTAREMAEKFGVDEEKAALGPVAALSKTPPVRSILGGRIVRPMGERRLSSLRAVIMRAIGRAFVSMRSRRLWSVLSACSILWIRRGLRGLRAP